MAAAFDANDSELVVVLPTLFTEQAAELPVVWFVICVPPLRAVVEIHLELRRAMREPRQGP